MADGGGVPADNESRRFWDDAARDNAAWYIATAFDQESDAFFAQGSHETDALLAFCGVELTGSERVAEIGCGVGRMTRRLAQLSHDVIGLDVSAVMLERAASNLAAFTNVRLELVDGEGGLPLADGSVDLVFSYVTLQHVPSKEWQLRYLREATRVLRPGGRLAVQIRASSVVSRGLNWSGHVAHRVTGRRTLSRAWRGKVLRSGEVRRVMRNGGVHIELKREGVRHVWVTGTKAPDSP